MKEFNEMNKKELHKLMTRNNKEMRGIANGTAGEFETMDYSYFNAINDENSRINNELKSRGRTAADVKKYDIAIELRFAANKALEEKLGY